MSGLTHQSRQSHHTQVTSLALGVPTPGQLTGRGGRDVSVKIGCVKRQHVHRQLEMLDGRAGDHVGVGREALDARARHLEVAHLTFNGVHHP